MNIDLIGNQSVNRAVDMDKNQYGDHSIQNSRMKTNGMGYSLDITGKVMDNAAYGKEELKSAQEVAQAAGMHNITLERNYMAVMSNSMSSDDFAELIKDGVNPTNTTVEESVTNLDKIKIRMAEAGITIEGFNDNLSADEVGSVVGNAGYAGHIAGELSTDKITAALKDADLPETKKNIDDIEEAMMIASNLTPISDEAIKYMLVNDLDPTVQNVYKAEHSSGVVMAGYSSGGVSYTGVAAYADAKATDEAWEDLKEQALNVVNELNIEDTQDGLDDAKWLVENQIPLSKDTLEDLREIKDISLPMNQDELLKSMTNAIADGVDPKDAVLSQSDNLYEKAVHIVDDFTKLYENSDITKRRQLEEVRLAMTAEASLTLLRKGFEINLKDLEGLVEKLKEAEEEFYRPLLEVADSIDDERFDYSQNAEPDVTLRDKIDLYKATRAVVERIPEVPVEAVYESGIGEDGIVTDFTLTDLSLSGQQLKDRYEEAGKAYETLMTAPRADMGDSIRKAFANVDDILSDLDMDINEANRKAVRTLGYAQMNIDKQSIENIREVTMTVQRVISLMSPAKTLEMIRNGHNPLNENIYDLEKSLSEEPIEETNEKYSRFLWNLEKNGEITENEKTAYIGMYRLFNLIEKQDGRVIGNVLASGEELTMKNMLSASRSNRHKNMDIKVDDDFGLLEDLVKNQESISDQISRGFASIIQMPVRKDYIEEKLKDTREAAKKNADVEDILNTILEPVTVENIIAVSDMVSGNSKAARKLFGKSTSDRDESDAIELAEDDADELINDFTDKESAQKAYERYVSKALDVAQKRLNTSTEYRDVKEWSLIYKQIGIAGSMGRREAYDVPLKTGDGFTSVHLTIKHGGEDSGKVTASFTDEKYGTVKASFVVRDGSVDGFIVSDSRYGTDALNGKKDILTDAFGELGIGTKELSVVYGNHRADDDFAGYEQGDTVSNRQLYEIAKAFIVTLSE